MLVWCSETRTKIDNDACIVPLRIRAQLNWALSKVELDRAEVDSNSFEQ